MARHWHSPHVAVQLHSSSLTMSPSSAFEVHETTTDIFAVIHTSAPGGEFVSRSEEVVEARNLESDGCKPLSARHLHTEAVLIRSWS